MTKTLHLLDFGHALLDVVAAAAATAVSVLGRHHLGHEVHGHREDDSGVLLRRDGAERLRGGESRIEQNVITGHEDITAPASISTAEQRVTDQWRRRPPSGPSRPSSRRRPRSPAQKTKKLFTSIIMFHIVMLLIMAQFHRMHNHPCTRQLPQILCRFDNDFSKKLPVFYLSQLHFIHQEFLTDSFPIVTLASKKKWLKLTQVTWACDWHKIVRQSLSSNLNAWVVLTYYKCDSNSPASRILSPEWVQLRHFLTNTIT